MVAFIIFLLLIIGLPALFAITAYNKLVRYRNQYKNAFAQIDVQLNRRYDLIPNLVETAKSYMKHERDTLEAVIQARNQAQASLKQIAGNPDNAQGMEALMGAESMLGGALGRLFAVSEAYPDLKANQNMMQLSEELTATENKVAFARQGYNDSVMVYNNARETFPSNIVAGMFNFKEVKPLDLDDKPEAREAVKVSFD
jgi:LemA protein